MDIEETNQPVIAVDHVLGTAIYNPAGDKLGTIETVIIDKASGQVVYVVAAFGGFLGIGSNRYPVPWHVLRYSLELDGYVAPLDKENLSDAPSYAPDSAPAYTSDYRHRIAEHYGPIKPPDA